MKTFIGFSLALIATQTVSAAELKCANEAIKKVVQENYNSFEVGTNSCGAKVVYSTATTEAYAVCTSDETESSEYLIVFSQKTDKDTKITTPCEVQSITYTSGPETPSFDEGSAGEIKSTIECSIDDGGEELSCSGDEVKKEIPVLSKVLCGQFKINSADGLIPVITPVLLVREKAKTDIYYFDTSAKTTAEMKKKKALVDSMTSGEKYCVRGTTKTQDNGRSNLSPESVKKQ